MYGTTYQGGANNAGTVFEITPSGVETVLHSFGDGTIPDDGELPDAALLVGPDGNLYGTTLASGISTRPYDPGSTSGTVFRITPAGKVTILHAFQGYPDDGAAPKSSLISSVYGTLSGTTEYGGADDAGTVFNLALPVTPTLTGIFPLAIQAGNLPFTLMVTGSGFSHDLTVRFNGTTLLPLTVSSNKMTFTVPASLVATLGAFTVTVSNPDSEPSSGLFFTVTSGLTLSSVSPASIKAGSGAISITVTGTNFVNGCVVKWNGQPLPTYYLSPAQATATVPASLLTTAGTATITISNPHVYATAPLSLTVTAK